jgi:exosortase B
MYLPTLYGLCTDTWANEEQAHGPIILALSVWLLYREWPEMMRRSETAAPSAWGWPLLVVGALLYILGRSQHVVLADAGSVVWVLSAILLLKRGVAGWRALGFALFFMLFMIPLPETLVTAVTIPMKLAVSYVTEHILFWLGYPIARSGVVLQIGPYQLLVADACAGLHTLLTLEALGLFYLHVMRHVSPLRNTVLAILIVPISFTANVIRVMVLTLITYYFGDAAGQGFLHGFAGMVLFVTALSLILAVDSVLPLLLKNIDNPPREAKV